MTTSRPLSLIMSRSLAAWAHRPAPSGISGPGAGSMSAG
jgi:hypothetical protein